jgi:hypothetical protein
MPVRTLEAYEKSVAYFKTVDAKLPILVNYEESVSEFEAMRAVRA